MMESEVLKNLRERFTKAGHDHVFRFWEELDDRGKSRLLSDLQSIDLELLIALHSGVGLARPLEKAMLARARPPQVVSLGVGTPQWSPEKACLAGQRSLARGEVAVIVVAGGKGTRLGFPYPKGIFPIGPLSGISLFQLHVEKIRARSRQAGHPIPLCIMTSPATDLHTRSFFEAHENFGLDAPELLFFIQGTMPAVDADTGGLLLAAKDRLALSPDGHGGMLAALAKSGILRKLQDRGIRRIFYCQVDNPLVDICCPEFLGYHILSEAMITTQVVCKKTPFDRLGNVIEVDGRLYVVEYSDLPPEFAELKAPDGNLLFRWGSIAVHVFELDFLTECLDIADALPWHKARKKVPYIDHHGNKVQPSSPNAIQFERFIFDLIPRAKQALLVAVQAEDHFAPLKNPTGDPSGDTPEDVRNALCHLWQTWVEKAGGKILENAIIEISPLFAVDPAELAEKLPKGWQVTEPVYLRNSLP
jgi:UDP-N-acetylglucosamine/UDP-N-acetylgalactosamine diphosphorylase